MEPIGTLGDMVEQFKRIAQELPLHLVLRTYGPVIMLLSIAAILSVTTDIHASVLLADTAATADVPWYTGSLSYLGGLLWCAAASICAFCGVLIRRTGLVPADASFLLVSAGLTALPLVDDIFLLHEEVFPLLYPAAEPVYTGVYGLLALGYLVAFRARLVTSSGVLLLIAASFLGMSMAFDAALDLGIVWIGNWSVRYLIEDGLKLLGIATWFVGLAHASMTSLRSQLPVTVPTQRFQRYAAAPAYPRESVTQSN